MRLGLLSGVVAAGLLSVIAPRDAAAAPVTTAVAQMSPGTAGGSAENIDYYYRGHRYPYRYGGHYYRHRYYRHGRWHYY